MRVLIPYTPTDPKSRLSPVMSASERTAFAHAMLEDVVEAIKTAGHTPEILADAVVPSAPAPVIEDERPLSPAVNAVLDPPDAVIMADMPLVTAGTVADALERPGDVVIGPGRGGGTNLLVVRDDRFAVDYHGASLEDHRRIASSADLVVTEVDSHRISTDIDEPADLVEVLLHGQGRAANWLREHQFELVETDGRVRLRRS